MVDQATRALVDDVLRQTLGHYGYKRSDIEVRRDQDGERALFIIARFERPDVIPASRDTTTAMSALRLSLVERDDERFPYLDYVFPEEPATETAS